MGFSALGAQASDTGPGLRLPIVAGYYVHVEDGKSDPQAVLHYDGGRMLRWLHQDVSETRVDVIVAVRRSSAFYYAEVAPLDCPDAEATRSVQIEPLGLGRIGFQDLDYGEMKLCRPGRLPGAIRDQLAKMGE